jgi:hypothetical protein
MEAAKETLGMAEKSGDRSIRIMGMLMLGLASLATVLHAGHAIYRDLFAGKGRKDQGPSHPATPRARPESPAIDETPHQGDGQSWVRKARLSGRSPADGQARPAYRDRQANQR